jgi:enoyl-CoA hydratase/carnithine racemase
MSVAPEIAESGSRPPLVPEFAAESSANFRADNAEALGLINHHRNSNIAAESKEEAERIAKELRKSISGVDNTANHNTNLQSLRDEKARLDSNDALDEALEA